MRAGKNIPEKNALFGLWLLEYSLFAAGVFIFFAGCKGKLDPDVRLSILYMLLINGAILYVCWSLSQARKIVRKSIYIKDSVDVLSQLPPEGTYEEIGVASVDASPNFVKISDAVQELQKQANVMRGNAIVIPLDKAKYQLVHSLEAPIVKYFDFLRLATTSIYTDLYGDRKASWVGKYDWWNPFKKR